MHWRKPLKPRVALMVLLAFVAASLSSGKLVSGEARTYVFYGYVPPTSRTLWNPEHASAINASTWQPPRLDVVGINDSTRVEVYDLADKRLIESFTVSRMGLHSIQLPNETFFKVVSDKLVAVLLSGGGRVNFRSLGVFPTFYPSTDGGFSGKEFVFMATPTSWELSQYLYGPDMYQIFAVESTHITIYDGGAVVQELDAPAISLKIVSLRSGSVYRIVSTGRALVSGMSMDGFVYLPSLTGGFIGRSFVGSLSGYLFAGDMESIVVVALQDAEAKVYDMTRPGWHTALLGPEASKSLRAGERWFASFKAETPIRIESTGDITVLMGRGGKGWGSAELQDVTLPENIGDDISFIGAKAGETISFYAPTQAIVFATGDTMVDIDGIPTPMKRDEYQTVWSGVHTLSASIPIIIEVLGSANAWALGDPIFIEGYDNWGSYLISAENLEVAYPAPPPLGGAAELIPIIAAIAIIPIAIALVLARRRRAGKRSTQAPT